MDDLRRQLRQEQDKLRRLSKSHARLKETAREATARAQAAEALVTTARDVQRRAEKAMAKLDKTQKRAALSKQMVGERDEALRAKETSAREWAAQLQAKEEQLEAAFQRTAELDDEVRRGREMLSKQESETLAAQAQLQVVQDQRRAEIDAIKDHAQAQWSDFRGKQTDMLKERLEQSVADRITATAEAKIRTLAQQLLAAKQDVQQAQADLGRVQGKFDQLVAEMAERESAAADAVKQAKVHAEEKAWVHIQTARAALEAEQQARKEADARVQAASAARAEAEVTARESTRALAKAQTRARQAEVTLRSMTGDVEARAQAELRALQEAEARHTAERKADEMVQVLAATKGTLEAQIKEFAVEAAFSPTAGVEATRCMREHSLVGLSSAGEPSERSEGDIATALTRTEGVLEVMRTQVKVARDKMQRMRQLSADAGMQGASDLDALEIAEQRTQGALRKARREEEARLAAERRSCELAAALARAQASLRALRAKAGVDDGDDNEHTPPGTATGDRNVLVAQGDGDSVTLAEHDTELAVADLAQEADRMVSAHSHATRAVTAAARAEMAQTVQIRETEAEATVEAMKEHVVAFTAEQMKVMDILDAELLRMERQVEAAAAAVALPAT